MIQGFGYIANQENWDLYQAWKSVGQPPIIPQIEAWVPPPSTPTSTPIGNMRSGAGTYYLLPIPLFDKLHQLRDRFISKNKHRRLHPLI